MRRYLLILCMLVLSVSLHAQSTSYLADLDVLYTQLKKTPSYKDQIKGEKAGSFDSLYLALRADSPHVNNSFDGFYRLARLFFPLYDNHLGFYQFPEYGIKPSDFTNEQAVAQYRQSAFFRQYPAVQLNLDSLRAALATKHKDSVEGIYYYDQYLTVGLYRTSNRHELTGVVLSTTLPVWEKGQVAMRLYEYQPHYFRGIYGHPVYKYLMLNTNEKFRNHSLINSYFYASVSDAVYKKFPGEENHINIPRTTPAFQLTSLNPALQYLRLGNFSAMEKDMKVSQAFVNSIKDSLTAPSLIVDLRNNTGGAEKVSVKFLSLLKKYSKKGKVYVLVNNGTMSRGEIFTLQLRRLIKAPVYGQTTRGTLAYGVNYSDMLRLPGKLYGATMTDMRNPRECRERENIGVEPDHYFDNSKDWIEALIHLTR
ncbi:MAG: hypothetical protein J7621_18975 [Niastella sp.]|nr:hypothetical protein [Niastella sp.]